MKFNVKRYWEVCDTVTVEADSESEAIAKAHALGPSDKPDYVPDSMDTDEDLDVQPVPKRNQ